MAALLRDPAAAVWHDHAAFLALMAAQGWPPGAVAHNRATHPQNRRSAAAEAWAVENDITRDGWDLPDRRALARRGLAYDYRKRTA